MSSAAAPRKKWPVARKVVRILILLIICLVAGWQIGLAAGSSLLVDDGHPEAVLEFERSSPLANAELAASALAAGHRNLALRYARTALSIDPINQQALTVAALAGPRNREATLMGLSAALGWRDLLTQLTLAQVGIAKGSATLFAQRFDAYQRQLAANSAALPLIDMYIVDPGVQQAIASRLEAKPQWRKAYLDGIGNPTPQIVAGREALLEQLARTDAPPTRTDLSGYVERLDMLGLNDEAHRIWARFIADRHDWAGLLYDGDFEHVPDIGARNTFRFEWKIQQGDAGYAAVEQFDKKTVLHLHGDGTTSERLIGQSLWVSPGGYRLDVQARTQDGNPPYQGGLNWSVTCQQGTVQLINSMDGEGGPASPGRQSYSFDVPSNCPDPLLSVEAVPGDRNQATDLWIESVRLDRR